MVTNMNFITHTNVFSHPASKTSLSGAGWRSG